MSTGFSSEPSQMFIEFWSGSIWQTWAYEKSTLTSQILRIKHLLDLFLVFNNSVLIVFVYLTALHAMTKPTPRLLPCLVGVTRWFSDNPRGDRVITAHRGSQAEDLICTYFNPPGIPRLRTTGRAKLQARIPPGGVICVRKRPFQSRSARRLSL